MLEINEKSCRRAEFMDYVIYYTSDISEKLLEQVSKAEKNKSYKRDLNKILGIEIGKLVCGLTKIAVNWDLCETFGN